MFAGITDAGGEETEGWAVPEVLDEVVRGGGVSHV